VSWAVRDASLEEVFPALAAVFDGGPSAEEVRATAERVDLDAWVVGGDGEEPAGFALCERRSDGVHLWLAGVLPRRRFRGAGSVLLDHLLERYAEAGETRMTVSTFNRWAVMLRMLIGRGFQIRGTAYSDEHRDLKVSLVRVLRPRKELRLSLEERCNFQCIFCHNEGLGTQRREAASDAHLLALLLRAIELGHTDITFTGGEPLLQKDRLRFLVDALGRQPEPPSVTLVTNGLLLDDETLGCVRDYPGRAKIHVSLHASDAETFTRITGSRPGDFLRVVENVRRAVALGLQVKLNHVVVQGLNDRSLGEMIEFARGLGVSGVKMLELVVLSDNPDDFKLFYSADAVARQVARSCDGPRAEGPRKRVFQHREDASFRVEVQKLTCALGCGHCREVRDRTFASDAAYQPCFVLSRESFPVRDTADLEELLAEGDRIVDGNAAIHGDSSPTLVKQEPYVPARREVFFRVADLPALLEALCAAGFSHDSSLRFHEEHHRPARPGPDWLEHRRVLKIGADLHEPDRLQLVYTDHDYRQIGDHLETTTRFLQAEGPLELPADVGRRLLDRLDFVQTMRLEWHLQLWRAGQTALSVAVDTDWPTAKLLLLPGETVDSVRLPDEVVALLEPLREPLTALAERHVGPE